MSILVTRACDAQSESESDSDYDNVVVDESARFVVGCADTRGELRLCLRAWFCAASTMFLVDKFFARFGAAERESSERASERASEILREGKKSDKTACSACAR